MDFLDLPIAFFAGILTIASPCVLPLLPILLGTSVERAHPLRPLFVVAGFVLAFASLGIALSLLSRSVPFIHETIRSVSIVLLILFGLMRIWPRPYDWLITKFGAPIERLAALSSVTGAGNAGGFVLGMSLGAVWTPCAGPVLASILILAAKADALGQSSLLLSLFAVGVGIPMLLIAYGGKLISTRINRIYRHSYRIQQAFGVLLILTALAIHFQYDILVYAWIAYFFL